MADHPEMYERSDADIRADLIAIDEGDQGISRWEADFIESVCYREPDCHRALTDKQIEKAEEIIELYRDW